MSSAKCPECGASIGASAWTCPQCGSMVNITRQQVRMSRANREFLSYILNLVALLAIWIACLNIYGFVVTYGRQYFYVPLLIALCLSIGVHFYYKKKRERALFDYKKKQAEVHPSTHVMIIGAGMLIGWLSWTYGPAPSAIKNLSPTVQPIQTATPALPSLTAAQLQQIKELWEKGAAAKKRRKYKTARAYWEKILKIHPGHAGIQEAINKLPIASQARSKNKIILNPAGQVALSKVPAPVSAPRESGIQSFSRLVRPELSDLIIGTTLYNVEGGVYGVIADKRAHRFEDGQEDIAILVRLDPNMIGNEGASIWLPVWSAIEVTRIKE